MRRILGILLAFAGLSLVAPPPAEAAVTVTIQGSPSTFMVGEATTISGRASGARSGSTVSLQRRIDGVWTAVASKRVWSERTYSFTTTPPKGYQYFRVVFPWQDGQAYAASPTLTLTVQWRPTVAITSADAVIDPDLGSVFTVRGRVAGVSQGLIAAQYLDAYNGRWETREVFPIGSSGQFVARNAEVRAGTELRMLLPAAGPRLKALSSTVESTLAPYRMTLNSGVTLRGLLDGPDAATVEIPIQEGQEVSLAGDHYYSNEWRATVTSPTGIQSYPFSSQTRLVRFTAQETGIYVVHVHQEFGDAWTLWASLPKVLYAGGGGSSVSDLPGQPVDVTFTRSAGSAVRMEERPLSIRELGQFTTELLGPDGTPVPRWLRAALPGKLYRLDADGTYRFRIAPLGANEVARAVRVDDVPVIATSIDDPLTRLEFTNGTDPTIFEFDATPEQPFGVSSTADWTIVVKPDGSQTSWDQSTPQPGTYHVAVYGRADGWSSAMVGVTSPVHLDAEIDGQSVSYPADDTYVRQVWTHFRGTAGDIVSYADRQLYDAPSLYLRIGGRARLIGPDGQWVDPVFGGNADFGTTGYRLPTSGEYVFQGYKVRRESGVAEVLRVHEVELPGDGTPVEFNIDRPHRLVTARIRTPARTEHTVSWSQVSSEILTWGILDLSVSWHFSTDADLEMSSQLPFTTWSGEDVHTLVLHDPSGAVGTATLRDTAVPPS